MSFARITLATAVVPTHKDARALWRTYGGPLTLLHSIRVEKPLTASQFARLPIGLRERVVQ